MELFFRRQYAESWKKMQELRAQIQAQLKLADTLKKISETAGKKYSYDELFFLTSFCSGIGDIMSFLGNILLCSKLLIPGYLLILLLTPLPPPQTHKLLNTVQPCLS